MQAALKSGNIPAIKTENGLSILVKNQFIAVPKDHRNYVRILDALKAKDEDALDALLDVKVAFNNWKAALPEGFEIRGELVYFNGKPFREAISKKVMALCEEGLSATALLSFLRKLRDNPSFSAQEELLMFCQANGFMIHEDGDIIAYKYVREDYKDCYTGTIDNSVGAKVKMDRAKVDDNRNRTCSVGLHFAAYNYAKGGDRVMVVKLNPRDVVSIPNDYANQKGRCCMYEVIAERQGNQALPVQQVYTDADIKEATDPVLVEAKSAEETRRGYVSDVVEVILAEIQPKEYVTSEENRTYTLRNLDLWDLTQLLRDRLAEAFPDIDPLDISLRDDTTLDDIVHDVMESQDGTALKHMTVSEAGDGAAQASAEAEFEADLTRATVLDALPSALKDIEAKIVRRIVTNAAMFRAELLAAGVDPDNEHVIQAIDEAGLGGWR